ncbi:MAG: phospho-sugar mutase, partial [Myxococcales bacterium]|nr:phospho-sugar mutase [Myxococcales bacterium]
MTTESPPTSAIDGLDRLPLPEPMRAQIAQWLREPAYTDVRPDLLATVSTAIEGLDAESAAGRSALAELEDAFSGPVPIGTGGRRGPCGAGPNRVNAAMMRETARGLAMAIKQADDEPKVAIIYDTRASSRTFALVVAAALVADQIKVTLIDGPRPTPQLSYLARLLGCGAGVVISASHNPPTDNGIKVYGPDGAQVLGDRDKRLMAAIIAAGESPGSLPEINLEAITAGKVPIGVEHIDPDANPEGADKPYHDYVLSQGVDADDLTASGLKVVYTPLHGVGHTAVVPVLRGRGLEPIIVEAQLPDEGRFATVASANPESPEAFAMALEVARTSGADLIMATDPDADRVGAMARDAGGEYRFIDGNRLGVLMLDHVLRGLSALGSEELRRGRVLTTLVTSPLIAKLARAQDVECVDDLLVGFKFHAGAQAEAEDRPMIFACEESHGFLRGNQIRDKDGAIAALLLAECAASCKRAGHTLFERLDEIWGSHGYHREKTANLYAEGLAGRRAIAAVMDRLRSDPPEAFAGLRVSAVIDRAKPRDTGSPTRDLPGNVLSFELQAGDRACRLVLRPSGTEPKLKVYALA